MPLNYADNQTEIINLKESYSQCLRKASDTMRNGGIIAYPTEHCFGLGCHPKNYHAVKKILTLKHRPASKGLILIANDISQVAKYIEVMPDHLWEKLNASWPSSTSWLIPAAAWVPSWLKGNSEKIVFRVPAHKLARQLCKQCGHAIVSTSANRSGKQPARSGTQVENIFDGAVDYTIDGKCGSASRPSTIIDLLSDEVIR